MTEELKRYSPRTIPDWFKESLDDLARRHATGETYETEVAIYLDAWAVSLKEEDRLKVTKEAVRNDFDRLFQQYLKEFENTIKEDDPARPEKTKLTAEQSQQARELGQTDLLSAYKNALETLGYVADDYATRSLMHTVYADERQLLCPVTTIKMSA